MGHVAAIILAAGDATRMGEPKQLLPYRGSTLLRHAVEQACRAGFERIVVVVGAAAEPVLDTLANLPVETVVNHQWMTGMGSSIACGISHLEQGGERADVAAVLLGDQPFIKAEHLIAMREMSIRSASLAVAAAYSGKLGVPTFFRRELFAALLALPPGAGAGRLLNSEFSVVPFPLPEAQTDVDTPEDYKALDRGPTL